MFAVRRLPAAANQADRDHGADEGDEDHKEQNNPQPPRWRSEWANPERRPLLVRLNLNLEGVPWPDLVVALSEGVQL